MTTTGTVLVVAAAFVLGVALGGGFVAIFNKGAVARFPRFLTEGKRYEVLAHVEYGGYHYVLLTDGDVGVLGYRLPEKPPRRFTIDEEEQIVPV